MSVSAGGATYMNVFDTAFACSAELVSLSGTKAELESQVS
jgi:hypothetical protein